MHEDRRVRDTEEVKRKDGLCKGRADHREGAESPVTPQCRSYLNLKPNSPGKDIH